MGVSGDGWREGRRGEWSDMRNGRESGKTCGVCGGRRCVCVCVCVCERERERV